MPLFISCTKTQLRDIVIGSSWFIKDEIDSRLIQSVCAQCRTTPIYKPIVLLEALQLVTIPAAVHDDKRRLPLSIDFFIPVVPLIVRDKAVDDLARVLVLRRKGISDDGEAEVQEACPTKTSPEISQFLGIENLHV